jgi:cohesin loading factor subunit SCC2
MTENFASFEYKTLEEVLTIIRYLTTVLSTTGMQILDLVSPSHLLTSLREPARAPEPDDVMTVDPPPASAPAQVEDLEKSLSLMRTTVVIAMVMLLKAHLKNLYSVSEEYVSPSPLPRAPIHGYVQKMPKVYPRKEDTRRRQSCHEAS